MTPAPGDEMVERTPDTPAPARPEPDEGATGRITARGGRFGQAYTGWVR